MGGIVFFLVMIFLLVRVVRAAVHSGSGGNSQKRQDIIGRLTPEQRAQMEKLRQAARGGQAPASINVPRAADLTPAFAEDDEEEDLYEGNFYDEEWDSYQEASAQTAAQRAGEGQSQARQITSWDHGHNSPDCGFDDQSSYGMPWSMSSGATAFDSASRGSRLKGNSRWEHRPPLITPARQAEAPLFTPRPPQGRTQSPVHGQTSIASSEERAAFTQREMRKAVVMSEVLKRPRPGVAPRLR